MVRYENVNGQDVNIVDPQAIRTEVAAAFGMTTPTTSAALSAPDPATVVDVVNAGKTIGLAATVSQDLAGHGFTAGDVRDPLTDEPPYTSVAYGPGAAADAHNVTSVLGIDHGDYPDNTLPPNHIRVILGGTSTPRASRAPSDYGSTSTSTTTTAPDLLGRNQHHAHAGGRARDRRRRHPLRERRHNLASVQRWREGLAVCVRGMNRSGAKSQIGAERILRRSQTRRAGRRRRRPARVSGDVRPRRSSVRRRR